MMAVIDNGGIAQMGRGFDAAPYVAMLHVAARNYASMIEKSRANQNTYAEWRVVAELRQLLVYELTYMTREQFEAVMAHMAEEYYAENEEEIA